ISRANKITLAVPFRHSFDLIDELISGQFTHSPIYAPSSNGLKGNPIAHLFFHQLGATLRNKRSQIGNVYRRVIEFIRSFPSLFDSDFYELFNNENKKRDIGELPIEKIVNTTVIVKNDSS